MKPFQDFEAPAGGFITCIKSALLDRAGVKHSLMEIPENVALFAAFSVHLRAESDCRCGFYFACRSMLAAVSRDSEEKREESWVTAAWRESCVVFGRRRQAWLFISAKQRATELLITNQRNCLCSPIKHLKEVHNLSIICLKYLYLKI